MSETMKDQIAAHQRVVSAAAEQVSHLERIADRLIEIFKLRGRLYVLGNGGSAADAQHIAAELVGRFKQDRRPLPAIALTTASSVLTAVSNDLGAEQCFARRVEARATELDAGWAVRVTGTGAQVVGGLGSAKAIGAMVIGFTGRSGGMFGDLCDLCFRADHDASDRVQEMHQLAYHLICDRIERSLLPSAS